jgi:hypothetical protein
MFALREPTCATHLRKHAILRTVVLALMTTASAAVMLAQQLAYKGFVLKSPVGNDTAVRFFYYSGGDFFQEPLIFRPVEQEDPHLNTALPAKEGWITFLAFDEMSQLMQVLAQSNLPWKESRKAKVFGPFRLPDEISVSMDIEVISSMGTASAKLSPTMICETLGPLDSTLKTQRALLEFQHFRSFYGCQVPGFKFLEYQQLILRENAARRH